MRRRRRTSSRVRPRDVLEVLHRAHAAGEAQDEAIDKRVGRDQEHGAEQEADLAQVGLMPVRL